MSPGPDRLRSSDPTISSEDDRDDRQINPGRTASDFSPGGCRNGLDARRAIRRSSVPTIGSGSGFIGFGLIGKRHVLDFQGSRMPAWSRSPRSIADVSTRGSLIGGSPRKYGDFRALLDDRDVDAVVVSTPDHWHALMTMMACAAGKDVYVEKPLSLFVREGRWMVDVARRQQAGRPGGNSATIGSSLPEGPRADQRRPHR